MRLARSGVGRLREERPRWEGRERSLSLAIFTAVPLNLPSSPSFSLHFSQPKPRTKRRKADEEGASPGTSSDEGDGARAGPGPSTRRPSSTSNPLPADLSAKVLREARAQQAEVEVEDRGTRGLGGGKVREGRGRG